MDYPFKSPRVLSLCTGIGGIERGLKRAIGPIRTVAYVEIEAFIIENLLVGMEAGLVDAAPVWANLKTFPSQDFRGAVDGIIGGYPCQPFSTAGNRQGENDPRHLWPYIRKSIETIGPVWCFFENVAGHLSLGYGEVYRSLRDLGYSVEPGIYTAEEVGAPHERKRLFILALADTTRQRLRETWKLFNRTSKWVTGRSQELADSNGNGHGAGTGGIIETGSQDEGKAQRKERNELLRQWLRNVIGNGSEELVNTQGIAKRKSSDQTNTFTTDGRTWDEPGNRGEFVAGQGIFQYPWEHPRTIESGLGCTIDGYNFREDLLRALGNSVVEQTAELAFIDLLRKHLVN